MPLIFGAAIFSSLYVILYIVFGVNCTYCVVFHWYVALGSRFDVSRLIFVRFYHFWNWFYWIEWLLGTEGRTVEWWGSLGAGKVRGTRIDTSTTRQRCSQEGMLISPEPFAANVSPANKCLLTVWFTLKRTLLNTTLVTIDFRLYVCCCRNYIELFPLGTSFCTFY